LTESFFRSYDLPVVTLRPFNTYGPRQSARAVIPSIIFQALTSNVVYLGNLTARRDLMYVKDTVDGFIKVVQVEDIEGETFNLGTGEEIRIDRLAEEIIKQIGKKVEIRVDKSRLRPVNSEVQRLVADNTLAKERLNWEPGINIREGVRKTIRWIEENQKTYRESQYQI
jgi:dTDP-glucose 4,6-dehydratase